MGKGGDGAARLSRNESIEVHLYGKVLDVSAFSKSHPGGAKALRIFHQRDATEQFEMYHSPEGAQPSHRLLAWIWARGGD
eukprot:scaffold10846_cov32-Tisochrysis_lutea.AAC.3